MAEGMNSSQLLHKAPIFGSEFPPSLSESCVRSHLILILASSPFTQTILSLILVAARPRSWLSFPLANSMTAFFPEFWWAQFSEER